MGTTKQTADEKAMLAELARLEAELEEAHAGWASVKASIQREAITSLAKQPKSDTPLNITAHVEERMLNSPAYVVAAKRRNQAMQNLADFRQFWRQIGELLPTDHPATRHGTFASVRTEDGEQ